MDLTTTYLGLELRNPIIIGSSKITSKVENIKHCAAAGAGAVVLKSLFEEQILAEYASQMDQTNQSYWVPEIKEYVMNMAREQKIDSYLRLIADSKKQTDIPIIASINCVSANEWASFAGKMQDAGADALELNISIFPFNKNITSESIENTYVEILKAVKKHVNIPVSVKMGRYFTNIHRITHCLADEGAEGLVLFNRFYSPDIDISKMQVVTDNFFSSPDEKSIPMRWIALLTADGINCDLSASTGIHYSIGVVKQLLAGATTTQISTTVFQNGIHYINDIVEGLEEWMRKHRYKKISDFRGLVSRNPENRAEFERMQYLKRNFE
ncbi:MAG: dihydroorotate dehydrogenase-like protein [Lentimicrobiaceae bacterium]|jgi:dihydroorotate dehydrogenase (fumarate)|nr:dihydroorotate dehydrogenase-like protein [Lentimicrobiaceae bacterium]